MSVSENEFPYRVTPSREFKTHVRDPEPPTEIWAVWWRVPVDPEDSNMSTSDARCPKVILSEDGRTLNYSNVPTCQVSGTFAANLAAVLLSAAVWVKDHQ